MGRKAEILSRRFAPEGFRVNAPDLNVPSFEALSFDAMVEAAARALAEPPPEVIVGSSLGALVALALAHRTGPGGSPLVLIAPALAFGERWSSKLPDVETVELFHHGEGRILPIHRRFFERMASVTLEEAPPPVPVSIVMGTRDESVPFAQIEAVWRAWEASGLLRLGSRFHAVDGGDHGLIEFGDAIEAAVRERLPSP